MDRMDGKAYYSHIEVMFEMVKCMRGKEVCFLSKDYKFRNIKAHNIAFLFSNMRAFSFDQREYNIYISCMDFFDMPAFSFNSEVRREQSTDFIKNFKNYSSGFDLFIDIEGGENFLEEAKKLKALFDGYKVPYYVKNSGNGFHFVIPSIYFKSYLPNHLERKDVFSRFATTVKKLLDLKLLDTTVYDNRRVYKCPYSFDFNTGRVCLPLSDEEFNNFSFEMVTPEAVLHFGVKNRGLLLRNENGSKNIEKMFKEILHG